jgi:hypothetical protein
MKHVLSYILAFVIIVMGVTATAQAAERFDFGIKGGLNIAGVDDLSLSGVEGSSWDHKGGFIGGMFLRYNVFDMVGLQVEGLWSRKGTKGKLNLPAGDGTLASWWEGELVFDYIEVPVILQINLPVAESIYPSFYAGGQFSFEQKNEFKQRGGPGTSPLPLEYESFEVSSTRTNQFSWIFGTRATMPLGGLNLLYDFRFVMAQDSFLEDPGDASGETPDGAIYDLDFSSEPKHTGFTLMVGLEF